MIMAICIIQARKSGRYACIITGDALIHATDSEELKEMVYLD